MDTEREGAGRNRSEKNARHPRKKRKIRKKAVIIIVCVIAALLISGLAMAGMSIKPPSVQKPSVDDTQEIEERADGIYNVLVVGTDKVGLNTDTIMVMSLDSINDRANVMSIPRDTMSNVKRSVKKINAAYAIGAKNGKGNIDNLKKEVSYLLGFEVDNYVVVNLGAFEEIIDAIGGVTIDVPRNMNYDDPYQDLHIHLEKGVQTLSGKEAIGFVRYRSGYAEGDIGRVKAQQLFIEATAKQLASPSTLTKLPKLAEIVLRNMDTDLTNGEILWFAKEAMAIDMSTNLNMFVLPGHGQYVNRLSYYLPNETEILSIVNEYFNPYATPITDLNIVNVNTVVKQEQDRQSALSAEQRRKEEELQQQAENEASVNTDDLQTEDENQQTGENDGTDVNNGDQTITGDGTNTGTDGNSNTGITEQNPTEQNPTIPTDQPPSDNTQTDNQPTDQTGDNSNTDTNQGVDNNNGSASTGTDNSGYNTIPGEVLKPDAEAQAVTEPAEDTVV
ncbi:MAG: LCP family protein [Peptococcaceae bacterium]